MISTKIKNLRKANNLSQKELAQKLYVTDKTISSWEQGRTEPDIAMIIKLSEIFHCQTDYLLNDNNPKNETEMELKIALTAKEYQDLRILLKAKTTYQGEMLQSDTYLALPNRKHEYLRIGHRGNKNILTYKAQQENRCAELEVEVDNLNILKKIFQNLGFMPIGTVEKLRQTYLYLDKYEIALDQVKDVGYFVEIEIKKYELDQKAEYLKLIQVAKDWNLNLANLATKHYLDYRIEKNEKK